jgi:hypothetical protein
LILITLMLLEILEATGCSTRRRRRRRRGGRFHRSYCSS